MSTRHRTPEGNADALAGLGDRGAESEAPPLRGGAIVLAAQAFKLGLQVLGMALFARLLTPADFGLVAMVTALTGLLGLFADLGLPQVIIQRDRITHDQVSTLFWINLGFSVLLTLTVVVTAPIVAQVYADPMLTGIACGSAMVFLVAGPAAQYRALLLRQRRLRRLMLIDVQALSLSLVAGLGIAAVGGGPWSLVVMPITQVGFQLAATALASGWRPGAPVRGCGVRPMLRFGGDLLGVVLFGYLSRQLDKVGVGILYGADALGYYSRGYQLFMLPISQISTPLHDVIVPSLARQTSDRTRFLTSFRRILAALTWISAGAAFVALRWPEPIVGAVFGPGWDPVVTVLRNLAPTLALQPLIASAGWAFISLAEGGRYRRWALGAALIQGLAILAGLGWGIAGVALATTLCTWSMTLPWTLHALAASGSDLRQAAIRALTAPLAMLIALLALAAGTGQGP